MPSLRTMATSRSIVRTYLVLTLGNTLAASLIWGINTIFLLDAGLSNLEAFAANAFFTAGMVLFEVPTGVIADTLGRRYSFLLGTVTLAASTLLYVLLWYVGAGFWLWAVVSVLIGLGFTFFSGAVEAWLVDALQATGYTGDLEVVFGRAQIVGGAAMLVGSVAGGILAQATNLGVPYVLRGAILVAMFLVAYLMMRDLGFSPRRGRSPMGEVRRLVRDSVDQGLRRPPIRWLMLEALFTGGVGIYVFYALQPYLLELYGDPTAYTVAGLVAAVVAGAQMLGGLAASRLRKLVHRRTTALLLAAGISAATLVGVGAVEQFWVVMALVVVWGLLWAAAEPIRQAYLNGMIPSEQRATILSFDSLMSSGGGVWAQPVLGRAADIGGYGASFLVSAGISVLGLPFLALSRRERHPADTQVGTAAEEPPGSPPVTPSQEPPVAPGQVRDAEAPGSDAGQV